MVHNLMEEIVKQCLKDLQQRHERLKTCGEKVLDDIMAITLNNLPAKYVSSSQGEVYVMAQARQMEPDVYRELSHAIEKVLNDNRKSDFN